MFVELHPSTSGCCGVADCEIEQVCAPMGLRMFQTQNAVRRKGPGPVLSGQALANGERNEATSGFAGPWREHVMASEITGFGGVARLMYCWDSPESSSSVVRLRESPILFDQSIAAHVPG